MDDAATKPAEKNAPAAADFERIRRLEERLERLLREAAEVEVELSRTNGTIRGIPHYSIIEGRAHQLGKQLSCEIQQRHMNELVASQGQTAKCPTCNARSEVHPRKRNVKSVDGEFLLQELVAHCPCCRRDFFPSA